MIVAVSESKTYTYGDGTRHGIARVVDPGGQNIIARITQFGIVAGVLCKCEEVTTRSVYTPGG